MTYDTDIVFDVNPPFQLIEREDGTFWVEGEGLSLEVDGLEQGQAFIRNLNEDPEKAIHEYLASVTS